MTACPKNHMMNELNKIRKKIDEIDLRILKLFEERLDLMPDIARYKKTHQLPIRDLKREEKHLLSLVRDAKEENRKYLSDLFRKIMEISIEKQKE